MSIASGSDTSPWLISKYQLASLAVAGVAALAIYFLTLKGLRYAVVAAPIIAIGYHAAAFVTLRNMGVRPNWAKTSEVRSIVGTLLMIGAFSGYGMFKILMAPSTTDISYLSASIVALLFYFPAYIVVGILYQLTTESAR